MSIDVRAKRIYDLPDRADGDRVRIDQVWPRGVSRDGARLDEWAHEPAPSDEPRKWFDHRPFRFAGFRARERDQLAAGSARVDQLPCRAASGPLRIPYAARDRYREQDNAVVLTKFRRDV